MSGASAAFSPRAAYSKVGSCRRSPDECADSERPAIWTRGEPVLYSEVSSMIAVIGNVIIGVIALSLFTATVRIGRQS